MQLMADTADVLTPLELEQQYKIKRGTQATLRHRRQIPFMKLGGGRLIRYSRPAIEAWLATQAVAVKPI
jgi:predicted DNA-binding transcriptional regulator AlpA